MVPTRHITAVIASLLVSTGIAAAEDKPVGLSPDVLEVTVRHAGRDVVVRRNPDNAATIEGEFARTSRPCPPFCIQPASLAPGVETIGELEVIEYARRIGEGDDSIVLIDSRTPEWVTRGTIPGSINVPWTRLNPAGGASLFDVAVVLQEVFNVTEQEGLFDFSDCRTAVLFCNGMWCGQSPTSIRTLLRFGYPAHKLKWYRGGMQDWNMLGLTTVRPDS